MLPFDKGWRSLINIPVRYGVPSQYRSNHHPEHSIHLLPELQSICFDGKRRMEPWRLDMMEVPLSGRRDHMQ